MEMSERINSFQASPIRRLAPYAIAAEKRGVHVYHLNIGQPDIFSPAAAIEAVKAWDKPLIAYGESQGNEELREAFAEYYKSVGVDVSPNEVMITTGGSEALLFALMVLCDPGDEVIIPEPYYTNVHTFAGIAEVNLVPVTSRIEDNFALPPLSDVEKKITPRTRAIMLNSPNNPTGYVYSKEELETLLEMCKKHDIFLICDEVYREYCFDGAGAVSVLTFKDYADRTVVVDSCSKRFSMCGIRVGALISHSASFIREAMKLGQARLCPPILGQEAAIAAFNATKSPEYIDSVRAEYKKRRDCVVECLNRIPGVKASTPKGAFYLVAELPIDDADRFALFMLKDFTYKNSTVMIAPAAGFYENELLGKKQCRIAYVLNCDDLRAAIECLEKGLEAYNKL